MTDPAVRTAELCALADAAEAARDSAVLLEVRAKHERARLAWRALAEAAEARQARSLIWRKPRELRTAQPGVAPDGLPAAAG